MPIMSPTDYTSEMRSGVISPSGIVLESNNYEAKLKLSQNAYKPRHASNVRDRFYHKPSEIVSDVNSEGVQSAGEKDHSMRYSS